jgi:hypothetical protein
MDPANRERIVSAVRELEGTILDARQARASVDVDELTREVLVWLGVELTTYKDAIAADPDLASLERAAVQEALAGTPDPGPYDRISREAATGQPGDLSHTARLNVVRH